MMLPSVNSWILLILQAFLTCVQLGATLECICTTDECVLRNKILCTAANMCYVQKMSDVTEDDDVTDDRIIRGCIDESMPLLCENRRPEGHNGAWPILYCCQQDWCNQHIIPTDPPWAMQKSDVEDALESEMDYSDHIDNKGKLNKNQKHANNDQLSSQHNNQLQFNILYIAVPLAGACVMLAIVIFSLYLLKVKRNTKDYSTKPQAVSNIYKQKLPLILTNDAKRTDVIYPNDNNSLAQLSKPCQSHGVSCDMGNIQPSLKSLSHDSSESSTGSEAKLLV